MPGRAVGIDLGALAMHVVVVDDGAIVDAAVLDDVDAVVARCAGAARVGIDAPSAPSTGVHARDAGVSRKFAGARCGELAAGEQLGVWVPWVTPELDACAPWMLAGFRLWDALRDAGHRPIEVYPAGSVWLEARRWPPKKSTPAGLRFRRDLLTRHLVLPPFVELWATTASTPPWPPRSPPKVTTRSSQPTATPAATGRRSGSWGRAPSRCGAGR